MNIQFGRFSDSFKTKDKTDFWTAATKSFDENQYNSAYKAFFNYLKDDVQENFKYTEEQNCLKFEFVQGSKIIRGSIDNSKILAEANIASFEKLSVAFMRRLLEMNFSLYYSRFALKDNIICLKFDSNILDCTPWKLYSALKEVATRADKQDDILLSNFSSSLKEMDNSHVETIPDAEKELKYTYFQKWVKERLDRISQLNQDAFSGGISYMILSLIYKIDYLIAPNGTLMNDIEKISYAYFANDNKPYVEKNQIMKTELEKLASKSKEEFFNSLYRTKSTFGIVNPMRTQQVSDLIKGEIANIKWYVDNNYLDIAMTIFDYIVGYSLFSFGMPKFLKDLFSLYYNINEQDYFNQLGSQIKYVDEKLNEELIKSRILEIINEGKKQFPELQFSIDGIKYDSNFEFSKTYLIAIQNLVF